MTCGAGACDTSEVGADEHGLLARDTVKGDMLARGTVKGDMLARGTIKGDMLARGMIKGDMLARGTIKGECAGNGGGMHVESAAHLHQRSATCRRSAAQRAAHLVSATEPRE